VKKQVGNGSGFVKKIPDPTKKGSDPTGSGSTTLGGTGTGGAVLLLYRLIEGISENEAQENGRVS